MKKEEKGAEPFDEALKRLESILNELEQGELSLEETYSKFESGMTLLRDLNKRLEETETRIRKLVGRDGGDFSLEPLETAGDETDSD